MKKFITKYVPLLITASVLLLITVLYWCFVGHKALSISPKSLSFDSKDWANFATFVDGIYGTAFAALATFYLIIQIKKSEEANLTALQSLQTSQETSNFNLLKFQLKLISNRIREFNDLVLSENTDLWIQTFNLLTLDLVEIERTYRGILFTEVSRTAIQTIYSQLVSWLLKNNLSMFNDNKNSFFTEQDSHFRSMNFQSIEENLNTLKNSRLTTVGDNEPDYL